MYSNGLIRGYFIQLVSRISFKDSLSLGSASRIPSMSSFMESSISIFFLLVMVLQKRGHLFAYIAFQNWQFSSGFVDWKGGCPKISIKTATPIPKMSISSYSYGWDCSYSSGAIYPGVPTILFDFGIVWSILYAKPKSLSLISNVSGTKSIFSSLISLCTIDKSCAASSASTSLVKM